MANELELATVLQRERRAVSVPRIERARIDGDVLEVEIVRTERWVVRVSAGGQLPFDAGQLPGTLIEGPAADERRTIPRAALWAALPLVVAIGVGGYLAGAGGGAGVPPTATPPPAMTFALAEPPPIAAAPVAEPTVAEPRPIREPAPAPVVAPAPEREQPPVQVVAAVTPPPARVAPVAVASLPQVRTAVEQALQSNIAEPWAANGMEGYAVAGPIQVDGTAACRNVVIWAQAAGAPGTAIDSRKCMIEGGGWADPVE